MRIEHDSKQRFFVDSTGDFIYTADAVNNAHNVLATKMGYYHMNVYDNNLIVTRDVLEEHFERVENFNTLDFDKNAGEFIGYPSCFVSKNADFFITLDRDLSDNWDEYISEDDTFKVVYIYYKLEDQGDKTVNILNSVIKPNTNNSSYISIVLKTMQGYVFKQQRIKPLDVNIDEMYNDDFAPIFDHIVENLNSGKKGIVLFHGKAGTGKTNLIKHLTTLVPDKKFVFIPVSMIPYLTDPTFLSQLIDNKGSILVLEDCENFLKDREAGENSVVSTILNLSDGILSDVLGIQIIATFNAPLDKVDEALLRKGRLIDEYDFKELTVDKCRALAEKNGFNVEIDEPMTIAELFNIQDNSTRTSNQRRKIGFGA